MFQWITNPKAMLIKVSVLQEPISELNISLNLMVQRKDGKVSNPLREIQTHIGP